MLLTEICKPERQLIHLLAGQFFNRGFDFGDVAHGGNLAQSCGSGQDFNQHAPVLTLPMRIALADLKLDDLHVVYPGEKRYPLANKAEVVPLAELVNAK